MKRILFIIMISCLALLSAQDETMVVVYERALEGILTTSGDYFSHQAFTAGHENLPMGTIVKISNPANGKKVELTVNDRILNSQGLFWITAAAADKLGILTIYPTKVNYTITYKPNVKEVYADEINVETLPTLDPMSEEFIYVEPVYEEPVLQEIVEEPEPTVISVENNLSFAIYAGLSENLEKPKGDPLVPRSDFDQIKGYGVHVYTTCNSSDAIEMSKRIHQNFSMASYVEKIRSINGICYRVIIGDYISVEDARNCYRKLSTNIPDIFLIEIY